MADETDPTHLIVTDDILAAALLGLGGAPIWFPQVSPSATWTFHHTFAWRPSVLLFTDSDGDQPVQTDVHHPDSTTVVVEWPSAESGGAYLR